MSPSAHDGITRADDGGWAWAVVGERHHCHLPCHCFYHCLYHCILYPAPLRDIPSGCCFFTGPWTVTRSSLRMLRRVAAFCRPLRPVLLLVSFPRSRSPVVGVPGLCWMWRDVPFACQRRPVVGVLGLCWLLRVRVNPPPSAASTTASTTASSTPPPVLPLPLPPRRPALLPSSLPTAAAVNLHRCPTTTTPSGIAFTTAPSTASTTACTTAH